MNCAGITGYIYTFAQARCKYDQFFTLWEKESVGDTFYNRFWEVGEVYGSEAGVGK